MQKMLYESFGPAQSNIVVGTWKNRLNETVLLNTQNKYLNWWAWVSLQFYSPKVSISGP